MAGAKSDKLHYEQLKYFKQLAEENLGYVRDLFMENSADKDDNEDIVVFAPMVNIARMDPFTQQAIVTPMKNTVCGHVYDKRGIEQMMKLGSNFQCPCIGCCNKEPITMDSVTHDYEYAAWQRYYASQGTSKSTTDILNLSDTH